MFESHLAPASGISPHRDLSSLELWEISLERSRRRRELAATHRKAAPRRKGAAAAMSAALFVSPILPMSSAGARPGGGEAATAPPSDGHPIAGAIARFGDTGPVVAALQRELGVTDDGIFGPITRGAVGDFQARTGLPRTGAVDARTWQALFGSSISFQPSGSEVAQRVLAERPGRADAPRRRVARAAAAGSGGTAAPVTRRPRGAVGPPPAVDRERSPRTPAVTAPARPAPPAPTAPAGECGGPIVMPVSGTRTSGFGDGRNHAGVDIAAPSGTPVRAAGCGIVTEAGAQGAYGNIVCIQHSASFSTCYAHLSRVGTRTGAYVKVGEVIGAVGTTGRSTGPHLHFETRLNGRAQDPSPYLSGATAIPGGRGVARPARPSSRASATSRARPVRASAARPRARQALAPPARTPVAAAAPAPAAAAEPQAVPVQAQAAPPPPVAPTPAPAQAPAPAPAPAAAPSEVPPAQSPEPAAPQSAKPAAPQAAKPAAPQAAKPAAPQAAPPAAAPAEPAPPPAPPVEAVVPSVEAVVQSAAPTG